MLVQHGRLPETQSTDVAHVAARVPTRSSYAGGATALTSTSATGAGVNAGTSASTTSAPTCDGSSSSIVGAYTARLRGARTTYARTTRAAA